MIGLKVPKDQADKFRKILLKNSLINLDFKIKRSGEFVLIPLDHRRDNVTMEINPETMTKIGVSSFKIIETEFEEQKRDPQSLKDYLKGKVDPEKMDDIKKSFDIIGDVVILEIPEDQEDEKYLIGEAALNFTKRKAVFSKKSEIKGVIRTRELEHLAGDESSETVHTEYGARFMLDVQKVYFSPRLATERERIVNQVKDGETIIDMFAGVGPFAISIARRHDVEIYAIDINPDAIYYLEKNIGLNKVQGKIIPIMGDVKEVLAEKKIKADRIIMNLPGTACEFLETAVESLKSGGILHYYEFASDFESPMERIRESAYPREVKILNKRRVKSRSPGVWHVGIDALVC